MSTTAEIVLKFEESVDPLLFVEHALRAGWFFSEDGSLSILPPEHFDSGDWVLLSSVEMVDKLSVIRKCSETMRDFSISLMNGDGFDGGSWSFRHGYRELALSPDAGSRVLRDKVKTMDSQKYINIIIDLFFDFYLRPVELYLHQSLSWARSGA